jgi:hypothetical protein
LHHERDLEKVGKNKKIDKGKWKINGEIKIVESPTREFTFVKDVYTRYISTNKLEEKNCKDIKKLNDVRNKNRLGKTDFRFKSKGRYIQSKQGHSPVYE